MKDLFGEEIPEHLLVIRDSLKARQGILGGLIEWRVFIYTLTQRERELLLPYAKRMNCNCSPAGQVVVVFSDTFNRCCLECDYHDARMINAQIISR